jgi:hypothetical protein
MIASVAGAVVKPRPPPGPPVVTVTASPADLITARLGGTSAERKAALRRWKFDGQADAVKAMRSAFQLTGDPGLSLG